MPVPPAGFELPPAELVALLKLIKYRDWTLTLDPSVRAPMWALHIITPPEPRVCDHFVYLLPPAAHARQATVGADRFWLGWLHGQLSTVELHQLGDRLVIDGVRPFDPHKVPAWNTSSMPGIRARRAT